jgi:uncharacterized coiled-coil protein SlyX
MWVASQEQCITELEEMVEELETTIESLRENVEIQQEAFKRLARDWLQVQPWQPDSCIKLDNCW